MNIVSKLSDWHTLKNQWSNKTIGFIPTMGHLHKGHLSLCERSQSENAVTVVSIFVNPTQFNQAQDFSSYPRTLSEDIELLQTLGIDCLLVPEAHDMYSDHYQTKVTETVLSLDLEGQYRPGHFDGVLTIVLKLLNLAQATRAYFGEKDYQQLLLIKKMVAAFFLPTEIIGCPIVRAEDGLALSSRNSRLNPEQRAQAALFPQLLKSDQPTAVITKALQAAGFKVDYIAEQWQRRLGAVWIDDVRLIDNVPLNNHT